MSSIKEKTDISISVIVILLALGFILFYSLSGDTSFLSSSNKNDKVTSITIEDKTYNRLEESEAMEEEVEKDNTKILSEADTVMTVVKDSIGKDISLDTLDVNELSSEINFTTTDEQKNSIPKIKTFDFNENKGTEVGFEDASAAIDTQLKVEEIDTEDLEKNCIILIGSFTKNKNSMNLKTRLKKDGYDIFEVPYKNLVRIGVYSLCSKEILNKELRKIRKEYANDAIIFTQN